MYKKQKLFPTFLFLLKLINLFLCPIFLSFFIFRIYLYTRIDSNFKSIFCYLGHNFPYTIYLLYDCWLRTKIWNKDLSGCGFYFTLCEMEQKCYKKKFIFSRVLISTIGGKDNKNRIGMWILVLEFWLYNSNRAKDIMYNLCIE